MQTSSPFSSLLVALLVFSFTSDWTIQGTGALVCYSGGKCDGADCVFLKYVTDKVTPDLPCNPDPSLTDKKWECATVAFNGIGGKVASGTVHGCMAKGECSEHATEIHDLLAVKHLATTSTCTTTCETDNCNAPPKAKPSSAPKSGPGLLMMAANLLVVVVFLGM